MFELDGVWIDSVEALAIASPETPIHANVRRDISVSRAWGRESCLPDDAAAFRCTSKELDEYERLARELNNAEFGKCLCITNGRITWNGALSLRSTKHIRDGSQILATRGHAFWNKVGFPV